MSGTDEKEKSKRISECRLQRVFGILRMDMIMKNVKKQSIIPTIAVCYHSVIFKGGIVYLHSLAMMEG